MQCSRAAAVVLTVASALCETAAHSQDSDSEISRHFLAARQAQASGNFDLAAQEYRSVLRLAPDLPEAQANLGLVYHLQAKYEESAHAFEKALAAKPDLRGANLFLGIDYAKLGQARSAVPYLQRAVEQEPANKIARTWLCTARWDAGSESQALSELRSAAKMFPSDPDILFLLGQAYRNTAKEEAERGNEASAESYRGLTISVLSGMLAAAPGSARTHQLFGEVLAESGKNEEALAEYRKAENADPGIVGLHFATGELLWKMNKPDEAMAEFQQELQRNPAYAEASAAEGSVLVIQHQPERAILYLEKALRLKPALLVANTELGKAFLQRHEWAKAEQVFRKALPDDPEGNVHYLLATACKQEGKIAEANAAFAESRRIKNRRWQTAIDRLEAERVSPDEQFRTAEDCIKAGQTEEGTRMIDALEKHPGLSVAQEFELAELLNSKALYPQVVARFERIVAAQPDKWANRYNLAVALLEASQPREAVQTLESLQSKQPENGAVLDLLGMAYEAAQQPDRALVSYRKAVAADPANHDFYLDYTRLLIDLDRYGESEQLIESGLRRLEGDYALTIRLGSLQMMQGKFEDARPTFQKAIDANPSIALGHVALAQTYLREHRDTDALNALAQSRAKLAPDAMLEYYYGLTLVRLQRYSQAISPLENAARLNPGEAETHYLLGKSYSALENLDKARGEFEQTVRLNPQNASAYYQLGRVYSRMGDTEKARAMAERTRELDREQREDSVKTQRARLAKLAPIEKPDK